MSEWKKVKLGEITQIIDGDRGKNYPKDRDFQNNGYCLFLNTGNVTQNGFTFDSNQFINKEKDGQLRKGKLMRGDLVYTTRGTVGNVAYYSESIPYDNIRINSGMVILRVDRNTNPTFLYQLLKSRAYRTYFKSFCTGSAQPQLPIKNLSQIIIDIPDLLTQDNIATVLSRYDSIIENYQKQIKLLEEAAQRLYKEWFVDLRFPGHENTKIVDGVPEGWEKKMVGDIVKIKSGYAFKSKDWQSTGCPVVKIKDITGTFVNSGLLDCVSLDIASKAKQYLLNSGDLVIAMTGATIGKIGIIVDNSLYTNQRVGKFFLNEGNLPFVYCFFKLESSQRQIIQLSSASSAQPNISGTQLESLSFVCNKELYNKYNLECISLFKQMVSLQSQIRLLTEARDRLLPKLMSGEIAV